MLRCLQILLHQGQATTWSKIRQLVESLFVGAGTALAALRETLSRYNSHRQQHASGSRRALLCFLPPPTQSARSVFSARGTSNLGAREVSRTTSTGQGASRTTRSAVLPRITCARPVWPCVGRRIKSASISFAAATISVWATP